MTQSLAAPLIEVTPSPAQCQDSLIARLAQAETRAFAELIETYQHGLVNYVVHLCGCRSRAEDLAQESFIRLYRAIQKNPHREWQIKAYLYRIAVNLLCSQERRHKHFQNLKHFFSSADKTNQAHPQDELLAKETQQEVMKAIAKLPLRFRIPLILRELEGWRLIDIATCLDINQGTAKSRIHRGKQRLKTLLKGYWQGGKA